MATIIAGDAASAVEALPAALDDHHWTREAVRRYVEHSGQGCRPGRERRASAWVLIQVLQFPARRAAQMTGYSERWVSVAAARVNDWLIESGLAKVLVEAMLARREREELAREDAAEGACCEHCRRSHA